MFYLLCCLFAALWGVWCLLCMLAALRHCLACVILPSKLNHEEDWEEEEEEEGAVGDNSTKTIEKPIKPNQIQLILVRVTKKQNNQLFWNLVGLGLGELGIQKHWKTIENPNKCNKNPIHPCEGPKKYF